MLNKDIDYNQIEKWITIYNGYKQSKRQKQILTLIVISLGPLVNAISYGLARRSTDPVEDIIQVANIGLIKAIKRYKAEYQNLKIFLSYAIVGEIKHYLRDKTKLMKPPREILELSYRINKLSVEELELTGELLTQSRISEKLEIPKEKIREAIEVERRHIISLDQIKFDNNNGDTIGSNIPADDEGKENIEDFERKRNIYRIILSEAIDKLPTKMKYIITKFYFENYSQKTLAQELRTSQSNISRLQKRALKQLFDIITKEQDKDKDKDKDKENG